MTSTDFQTTISDTHFSQIAAIASREAGLEIPNSKKSLVQSRVMRRMRKLGIADCGNYLKALSDNAEETQHLISALTTNVSHFFREQHHFDFIEQTYLSDPNVNRLRFWSAGCSTGQEPYSLAIQVLKSLGNPAGKDILILATDIDSTVLDRAVLGRYSEAELESVPDADRKRFFKHVSNGEFQVADELKGLIRFKHLNLNSPTWPMRGQFDAILCRNVVIYFNADTQAALWPRFRAMLDPNGALMLGHSERIHPLEGSGFEPIGITTYRKT